MERLVRGYSCRVLAADPNATGPERGCVGQSDEVSATGLAPLKLANQSALQVLRDQLIAVGLTSGGLTQLNTALAIQAQSFDGAGTAQLRHNALEQNCLWEKLSGLRGGRFTAVRNYWLVDPAATTAPNRIEVWQPTARPLPRPAARPATRPNATYWFIRGGRLIGETTTATGELVPAAGLQGIDDNWLSVNPSTGTNAISGIEQQELGTAG
ncbi:MAG: hypothetical protein VKM98_02105, partial [Cyanobacteriota bacterium]|nr:hypothetical protein [Cyanobacteriota bacterium]